MKGLIFEILRYCTLPCPHTKRNKYNKKLSCRLSFIKENIQPEHDTDNIYYYSVQCSIK